MKKSIKMRLLRQGRGETIMVSAIGGFTDYSVIGSLNLLSGNEQTNSTDNSFVDILADSENDTTESSDIKETAQEKSDIYKYIKDSMGMPAGMSVEGFEYSQSSDSAAQSTSGTNEASSDTDSSENQQYDDMDLNKDGVVTAEEMLQYLQMQQQEELSETLQNSLNKYSQNDTIGGLNTKNAASAYQNTNSISGNTMMLNIAV